jgi:CDP-6-deoxy-D-xylo-4-hexulose-3-dehydrase
MISLVSDTIDKNDINTLIDWLKTNPRLTKGKVTIELEQKFAKWLGTKYSLFCNSGSSANLLMLYALKAAKRLKNNKIVIPGLCWATDLAPAIQFDYKPLLCDVNLNTLSVDLNHLEEIFIKQKPSVLLLVSILGFSPHINEIKKLCKEHDVILLEDNCESLGTSYKNKKLGNFGLMSSYSTYFGHHISTIEGGFVATNDKELYNILLSLRSHGWCRDWDAKTQNKYKTKYGISDFNSLYTFFYPGFNLRSTDLQAFIGLGQIDKLDSICEARNKNFNLYISKLKTNWKPTPIKNTFTSSFCYPLIEENRDQIVSALKKADIEVRPLVCGSIEQQPYYYDNYKKVNLKNCTTIHNNGLYVPNHPGLTEDQIDFICNIINANI